MTKKKESKLDLNCPACRAKSGSQARGRAGFCFEDFQGVRIHYPLPSKKLMTRQKHGKHWSKLYDLIAIHRLIGKNYVETAARGHRPLWMAATLTAFFYHPSAKHFQDDDNLDHWIKHYRDGIEDAGIVTNDRVIKVIGLYQDVAGPETHREGVVIVIRDNTPPIMATPTPDRRFGTWAEYDEFDKKIKQLDAADQKTAKKKKVKKTKKPVEPVPISQTCGGCGDVVLTAEMIYFGGGLQCVKCYEGGGFIPALGVGFADQSNEGRKE